MADLYSHVKELENESLHIPSSPALYGRMRVVKDWLYDRYLSGNRTVSAPIYVTDLGVRRSPDPRDFYMAHCRAFHISPVSDGELLSTLLDVDVASLADGIDAMILFFGDYETVASAITRRIEDIAASEDYRLLIHSGVVMAALEDSTCLRLFDVAAKCSANDSHAYSAHHRAAAFLMKRRNDYEAARRRLDVASAHLQGKDAEVNRALLHNLDALRLAWTDGDPLASLQVAKECIDTYIDDSSLDSDSESRACRYRSQIAINEAQIRLRDGDSFGAFQVMKDNVEFCRTRAFDYLSEALCEASYVAYLVEDFGNSIRFGEEGFWRSYFTGSPGAIKAVREIIVGSLYKSGKLQDAEAVAAYIHDDPLGLQGLHG